MIQHLLSDRGTAATLTPIAQRISNRKRRNLVSALGLFLATCFSAFSAGAADLYSATVRVADRSDEARGVAMRAALGQVLVKLSGDRSAARWADSQGGLEDAAKFVNQETYLMRESRTTATPQDATPPAPELYLRAAFSPSFVDPLLRQLDLPIWSTTRDSLLVWLAVDDMEGERRLVGEEQPNWLTALTEAGDDRGLEVVHPVLDATDRRDVAVADVWGALWEDVSVASERYGTPLIAAVRLEERGALWQATWSMSDNENVTNWTSRGSDAYDALSSGLSTAADTLGERYAVRAGELRRNDVTLTLSGVDSVAKYGRVMRFFETHSLVEGTTLRRASDGELELAVMLNTSGDSFVASIEGLDWLRPVSDSAREFAGDRRTTDLWLELR